MDPAPDGGPRRGIEARIRGRAAPLIASLVLASVATLLGASRYEPVGDELRYSAIIKNAEERGHWFDLRKADGELYRNKPPLIFWLGAVFSTILGPGVVAASLAPRLFAIGTVLLSADLARRWYGATAGMVTGVAIVTAPHFLDVGRELRTDSAATFGLSLAVWGLATGAPSRRRPAVFMTGTVIALLGKGLVGLLPIGCALCCLALPSARFVRSGRFWAWLALLAIPAAWELQLETLHERRIELDMMCDEPEATTLAAEHAGGSSAPDVARTTGESDDDCPSCGLFVTHFVGAGLLTWLPWSPFLLFGTGRDVRRLFSRHASTAERVQSLLLLSWAMLLVVGWALETRSYVRYFFLVLPPFAIVAGREATAAWRAILGAERTLWLRRFAFAAGAAVALAATVPTGDDEGSGLEEMRDTLRRRVQHGYVPVVTRERSEFQDELDMAYADLLVGRCARYVAPESAPPALVRTPEWRGSASLRHAGREILATRVMTLVDFREPDVTRPSPR